MARALAACGASIRYSSTAPRTEPANVGGIVRCDRPSDLLGDRRRGIGATQDHDHL